MACLKLGAMEPLPWSEVNTALVLLALAFERKPGEIWMLNSLSLYFISLFSILDFNFKNIVRSCVSLKTLNNENEKNKWGKDQAGFGVYVSCPDS